MHRLSGEIDGLGQVEWVNPWDRDEQSESNHTITLPADYGELHVVHTSRKYDDVRLEHNVLMEQLGDRLVANLKRIENGEG